jgi:hypothetical protein
MAIRDLAKVYFKEDEIAISFIEDLFQAWHIWDDLIDKDKPIADVDINKAFINAFIKIPRNQFYQINFGVLNPLMENAITSWLAANTLEATKENLEAAYELRNTYLNIIISCANIIGGVEWAATVAVDVQKNLKKNDSFKDYIAEFNKE